MKNFSRRDFLYYSATAVTASLWGPFFAQSVYAKDRIPGVSDIRGSIFKGDAPAQPGKWSCEAFLYEKKMKETS